MKKNKFYFALLLALWVPLGMMAQNRDRVWWVDEYKYSNTMNIVAQVYYEDVLDASLELGVFCGDECRGIIGAQYEPAIGQYFWYLTIQGEGNGESLEYYVRRDGVELEAVTSYSQPFVVDGVFGMVGPGMAVPINFVPSSSSYYILITDESQLVEGRPYLIANGFEGDVKAMGADNEGERAVAEITCSNHKAYLAPGLASGAYEFVLGSVSEAWTFYDETNEGYLTAGQSGALNLSEGVTDSGEWTITIDPTGALTIYNETNGNYIRYDESQSTPAFDCGDECTLYFLAKCELVSGTKASLAVTEASKMYVVESGEVLEVNDLSTVNVSSLVLEDGAQLINASSGVLATMQKNVTGYDDVTMSDGWYTLASPMAAAPVATSSNVLYPDYDLYAFDETNLTHEEWRNYKENASNGFTSFEAGRGYLYANATSFTPLFKGTLNHNDVTFSMTYTDARPDELKGFNLVGNPFPHVIYKGAGGAIDDGGLASGYYALSNSGAWVVQTYETPIEPAQGILVKTTEAGDLSIAKTTAVATGESTFGGAKGIEPSRVDIHLNNGNVEDAAYVYLGRGNNLVKIGHLNATMPSLSVAQNKGNFAIAHVDPESECVDLCFDNRVAGTFTITVKVKAWESGYLHLIDNVTGADVNLLRSPSYTFDATGYEYSSRFKLVMKGVEDENEPFAYFDGNAWNVYSDGEATLQVIDVLGHIVSNENINGSTKIAVNVAQGMYVLRLVNGENVKTQKVVVR